jgi:hypothetical protein
MKSSILLLSLVLVTFLVGCNADSRSLSATSQVAAQHRTGTPKFGWKEFHQESFETHPVVDQRTVTQFLRSSKWFSIPSATWKLRVMVKASSALCGGVFPEPKLILRQLIGSPLKRRDFAHTPCVLDGVTKGELSCEIDRHASMALYVRDARSKSKAGASPLPDKVQISLSRWQCIENCEK